MRASAFILSIVLGLLAGGCGSEQNRSWPIGPSGARVEFQLELSSADGSPTSPITAQATARNLGNAPAFGVNPSGCACDGVEFDILDSAGKSLFLRDPCGPVPVCLCVYMVLNGGATYERPLTFKGERFRMVSMTPPTCVEEPSASGDYVVVARFTYFTDQATQSRQVIERRAPFHWTGP
jgi:hypothetical protein